MDERKDKQADGQEDQMIDIQILQKKCIQMLTTIST